MKILDRFTKKADAATLVKKGLAHEDAVSIKQIRNCIFLLADTLGDTWKTASKEVAAGMVLIVLAKNAELKQCLNSNGWKLVVGFVSANPEFARNISPRTMGEIFSYQADARAPMLASGI